MSLAHYVASCTVIAGDMLSLRCSSGNSYHFSPLTHIYSQGSLTRNTADADKPRDAFRGQSRSAHKVPYPYVRYCFLLVCYSNFVPSRAVFQIFDFKECRDLEIWVRGHLRSLKVVPFNRLCMVSYYCPIVTLSRNMQRFLRYSTSKMPWPWKPG